MSRDHQAEEAMSWTWSDLNRGSAAAGLLSRPEEVESGGAGGFSFCLFIVNRCIIDYIYKQV